MSLILNEDNGLNRPVSSKELMETLISIYPDMVTFYLFKDPTELVPYFRSIEMSISNSQKDGEDIYTIKVSVFHGDMNIDPSIISKVDSFEFNNTILAILTDFYNKGYNLPSLLWYHITMLRRTAFIVNNEYAITKSIDHLDHIVGQMANVLTRISQIPTESKTKLLNSTLQCFFHTLSKFSNQKILHSGTTIMEDLELGKYLDRLKSERDYLVELIRTDNLTLD